MNTKKLGWKENHGIQNIGIEGLLGNMVVGQNQILKFLANHVT
jgi:hypothetical protein